MNEWLNKWMNDKRVYRTALATPSLLSNDFIGNIYVSPWINNVAGTWLVLPLLQWVYYYPSVQLHHTSVHYTFISQQ